MYFQHPQSLCHRPCGFLFTCSDCTTYLHDLCSGSLHDCTIHNYLTLYASPPSSVARSTCCVGCCSHYGCCSLKDCPPSHSILSFGPWTLQRRICCRHATIRHTTCTTVVLYECLSFNFFYISLPLQKN
jgi:hypothetical protein